MKRIMIIHAIVCRILSVARQIAGPNVNRIPIVRCIWHVWGSFVKIHVPMRFAVKMPCVRLKCICQYVNAQEIIPVIHLLNVCI